MDRELDDDPKEPTEETPPSVEAEPPEDEVPDFDALPEAEARRLGRYFARKARTARKGELRYRRTLRDREQELAEVRAERDAARAEFPQAGGDPPSERRRTHIRRLSQPRNTGGHDR